MEEINHISMTPGGTPLAVDVPRDCDLLIVAASGFGMTDPQSKRAIVLTAGTLQYINDSEKPTFLFKPSDPNLAGLGNALLLSTMLLGMHTQSAGTVQRPASCPYQVTVAVPDIADDEMLRANWARHARSGNYRITWKLFPIDAPVFVDYLSRVLGAVLQNLADKAKNQDPPDFEPPNEGGGRIFTP